MKDRDWMGDAARLLAEVSIVLENAVDPTPGCSECAEHYREVRAAVEEWLEAFEEEAP